MLTTAVGLFSAYGRETRVALADGHGQRPTHTNIYTHTHIRVKVTDLRLKNRTQTFSASFRFDSRYEWSHPERSLFIVLRMLTVVISPSVRNGTA